MKIVLIMIILLFLVIFINIFRFKQDKNISELDTVIVKNITNNDTFQFTKADLDYYNENLDKSPSFNKVSEFLPENYLTNIKLLKELKEQIIQDRKKNIIIPLQNNKEETICDKIQVTILNDTQNVHDTYFQTSLKNHSLNPTNKDYKEEIVNLSENPLKCNDIINKIYNRNTLISSINKTEKDILNSVWETIKNDPDLIKEFYYQLEDCEKNGNLHCSTGVFSRLHSVLFFNNLDNYPKTRDLLKKEILHYFSSHYEIKDKKIIIEDIKHIYSKNYSNEQIESILNEFIDFI